MNLVIYRYSASVAPGLNGCDRSARAHASRWRLHRRWVFSQDRSHANCFFFGKNIITPWKINGWNLQITHLERKMIFQTSMIMFHVNLPGCKDSLNSFKDKPFLTSTSCWKAHVISMVFFAFVRVLCYSSVNGNIQNLMAFSVVLIGLVFVYVFESSIIDLYCWWKKTSKPIQVGSLSHYFQGFVHPRWLFGISEPSTISWWWWCWLGVGRSAFVSGSFKLNVDEEDGQPTAHPR